ncbi:MAG: hypothetical protein HYU66_15125, partial [Armatimonadetes bacterium]|nr:hypothetical protein [Armatimonadota bacterium]
MPVVALLAGLLLAAPAELLPNRSFEDVDAKGLPTGWGCGNWEGGSTVRLDHEVRHSGAAALRIDGHGPGRGAAYLGFGPAQTDPRSVYLLSAWVRV